MRILLSLFIFLWLVSASLAGHLTMGDKEVNFSSYLQVRYSRDMSSLDQFSMPRVRTNLWGDLSERISYFLEYDFVESPALIYSWLDVNTALTKISVGRIYLPFSLEYTTPKARLETINTSSTLWNYFGYGRDIGLKLSDKFGKLKYDIALVNGVDNQFADNNETKDLVGRLVFMPNPEVSFGFSGYTGKSGSLEVDKKVGGLELGLRLDQFAFEAEYIAGWINNVSSRGYYLQPLVSLTNQLQALVRFESWDPDLNAANDFTNIITLGLNYYFDQGAKLQVNYEIKSEETNHVANNALLTQLQVSF